MLVDVMTSSGLTEVPEVKKSGGGEPPATTDEAAATTVPDLFAGMLAALTPLADQASQSGSTGEEAMEPTVSEPPPPAAMPGGSLPDLATAGRSAAPDAIAAPAAVETAGPVEVLRSAQGIPLAPPPPPVEVESDVRRKILPTSTSEKPALRPWGGTLATLRPAGPRPVIEPETTEAGSQVKPVPETGTAATPARPDGRPVVVAPTPAATLRSPAPPTPPPSPEPELANDAPVNGESKDPAIAAGTAADTIDTVEPATPERLQPPPRPELSAAPSTHPVADSAATTGVTTAAPAAGTIAAPPVAGPEIVLHHPGDTSLTDTGARPPVDPERIRAQVVKQMLGRVETAGSGEQKLTLQLDPEHLGKIEVKLVVNGGRLEVIFSAETAEAQHALREGSQDLARNLGLHSGRWQQVEIRIAEPAGAARNGDDQDDQEHPQDERSEQGSHREREDHQRRRHGDER